MLNGVFYNPTAIHFGRGTELLIGEEVAKYSTHVLLHYGCRSCKENGLYEKITSSLKRAGVNYTELEGVQPNPRAELVYKGIEICRQGGIDFILAVGGGSVIDSAKAIGIGVPWSGDFFDFYEGKHVPVESLKVAALLTIPGSGSESSASSIITHETTGQKLSCYSPVMAPLFSVLNPEFTYTLSPFQTTCGIIDAITHVLERYFTNTQYVDCTDRICESLVKTLMKYAPAVLDEPFNYDIRAEIMWACKMAHDNSAGFGRKQDWASHTIAHEIGALYDISHGAIMSVIFPAWMSYVYTTNSTLFMQLAERVFNIRKNGEDVEYMILAAFDKFRHFLTDIKMPVTLREVGIADKSDFSRISERCVRYMKSGTIGNFKRLSPKDIVNILEIAY